MLKALPNSFTKFAAIIDENYAFVDKTRFLEVYENSKTKVSMFLRPRRFGKTMFTELLRYYYDIALKEEADRLFKDKYIASHPTPLKNSYYVLKFDFSGIGSNGSFNDIMDDFRKKVINGIADFLLRYPVFLLSEIRQKVSDSNLNDLHNAIIRYYSDKNAFPSVSLLTDYFIYSLKPLASTKLMVIIDEYDNFTNDILSKDPGMFKDMARKGGQISAFYQVLRACNQDYIIDKIYVTGVLPITMDTSISGFVSENLTSDPQFNEMAGFTDDEVMDLLRQTVDFEKCPFSPEVLREEMKKRYDGYRFADNAENTVYNATMCLNFIRDLQKKNQEIPPLKIFADVNIDFDKLYGYFMLINEQPRKTLIGNLNDSKPVKSNVGMAVKLTSEHETFSYPEGATVLYHLGFLTMMSKEKKESIQNSSLNDEYLAIPNSYYNELFARFQLTMVPQVLQEIETLSDLGKMAVSNDISVLSDMLYRVAGGFTQTDVSREGENQVALTVYAAISAAAGKSFNLTKEYAIKRNGQYVFADGLEENEYLEVNEADFESDNEKEAGDKEKAGNSAAPKKEPVFVSRFSRPQKPKAPSTLRGRADLVAINTNPKGPSYIFEFKYKRNTRTSEMTKDKVREALYNRAVKQLNFYVADDYLKTVPDLRKYVIMYTYGEFFIEEIV
ncbi:AAA family ATPase [Succinimonas sp.]|uniref:AAA family ATPase n=1 Tax=Succinimonas sp. TaxID=1936151 RepID=UPI00386A3E53